MFYLVIFISVLGFSLQGALIAKYSRKMDSLSVTVYRNMSLVFSLSPLLFFATSEKLLRLVGYLPILAISGLLGMVGLVVMLQSHRYLPVGINSGFRQSASIVTAVVMGSLFFRESISLFQAGCILLIIVGCFIVGKTRIEMAHLNVNTFVGIGMALLTGFLVAISLFILGKTAREVGPFVSAYFWEMSVGVCSILFIAMRTIFFKKAIESIALADFLKITVISSPTLFGTGGAALAISMGPFGIMRAVSASTIFFTVLWGYLFFGEKLARIQWLGISVIFIGIVVMRLL